MLDIVIFAIVSALGILFSVLVFTFRDILHATVALASLFFANSLLFLLLNEPLLAIIQLFVMVGGISTFLFVGVAAAPYSKFKYTRILFMAALWIVFFAAIAYPLTGMQFSQPQPQNQGAPFGVVGIAASLSSGPVFFYLILLLMFGVALGAVLLLKRAGVKK
jgi:NADH-quinone oxidoreductase subunit J